MHRRLVRRSMRNLFIYCCLIQRSHYNLVMFDRNGFRFLSGLSNVELHFDHIFGEPQLSELVLRLVINIYRNFPRIIRAPFSNFQSKKNSLYLLIIGIHILRCQSKQISLFLFGSKRGRQSEIEAISKTQSNAI